MIHNETVHEKMIHPNRDELLVYVKHGLITGQRILEIAGHLVSCDMCAATVQMMQQEIQRGF